MRLTRPLIFLTLAAACLLAAGCDSTGGGNGGGNSGGDTGGSGGGGGSTSRPSSGGGRTATTDMQVGRGDDFGPAARSRMNAAWDAFKKESPEWPRLRAEWVALGQRATNTLVENLFRAMIVFRLRNFPRGYDACRKELILLGDLAVPTLAGILREPYYLDPVDRKKEVLPIGVVTDLANILSHSAPTSVRPLAGLLEGRVGAVRRACAGALAKTKDPSALGPLVDMLDDGDWLDRIAAAQALGNLGHPGGVGPLVSALSDSEDGVVEEAARALARLRARSAISALESRRARAQSESKYSVAAACGSAVKAIRSGR